MKEANDFLNPHQSEPAPNELRPIDWQLCLKLANNKPDLASEMLAMFVSDLPAARFGIHEAYQLDNLKMLLNLVHKLHGASSYCGVPQLKKILMDFEAYLKRNQTEKLNAIITKFNSEVDRILAAYQSRDFKNN